MLRQTLRGDAEACVGFPQRRDAEPGDARHIAGRTFARVFGRGELRAREIGREIAFDEVKLFAKRHLRQHRRRALGRRPSGVLRQGDLLRRLAIAWTATPAASATRDHCLW